MLVFGRAPLPLVCGASKQLLSPSSFSLLSFSPRSPLCKRANSSAVSHVNVAKLTECYKEIITASGEDVTREGLVKTPIRAAKAFAYFVKGYGEKVEDVTNGAIFHEESKDLVLVKDINFCSLCEHHLVPFFGKVHIAYIPNGKVIGLSKLARITDVFARRLQLQERLTREISTSISKLLDAQGVAVSIEATHMCMTLRGVQQTNALTMTNSFVGVFEKDPDLRNRYLHMIRAHR